MSAGLAWMQAFPMVEASRAVEALRLGWQAMAATEKPGFNPKTHEPKLTRVLRAYVRKHVAVEMKLPGHWGTEGVENDVDFTTGRILEEGRTDITYLWNSQDVKFVLVFEFKKLRATSDSRKDYLGSVRKFVTGVYSEREPLALMVAIHMADPATNVAALRRSIAHPPTAAALFACQDAGGSFVHAPAAFPSHAAFDTEHLRSAAKAPAHGTLRLAHMFVEFPYITYAPVGAKRGARLAVMDDDVL